MHANIRLGGRHFAARLTPRSLVSTIDTISNRITDASMTQAVAPDDASGGSQPTIDWYRLLREYRSLAIILIAQLPLMLAHLAHRWQRPHDRFFPVVLLAMGYFFWSRLQPFERHLSGPRFRWQANILFAVALASLIVGTVIVQLPAAPAVAFSLSLGGVMLLMGERYFIRNGIGVWLLSLLLIPFSAAFDQRVLNVVNGAITALSGVLLEILGFTNTAKGTTLSLSSGDLLVGEACAGVVSLMSLIACALIIAVWRNRPAIHMMLLMAGALPLTLAVNVGRVVLLVVVAGSRNAGPGVLMGGLLSICLILVSVLLVLSMDRFLAGLLAPLDGVKSGSRSRVRDSWIRDLWNDMAMLGTPRIFRVASRTLTNRGKLSPLAGRRREMLLVAWAGLFVVAGVAGTGFTVARAIGSSAHRTHDFGSLAVSDFPLQPTNRSSPPEPQRTDSHVVKSTDRKPQTS